MKFLSLARSNAFHRILVLVVLILIYLIFAEVYLEHNDFTGKFKFYFGKQLLDDFIVNILSNSSTDLNSNNSFNNLSNLTTVITTLSTGTIFSNEFTKNNIKNKTFSIQILTTSTNKIIENTTFHSSSKLIQTSQNIKSNQNEISSNSTNLCPLIPPNLGERIPIDTNVTSIEKVELSYKNLSIKLGGESAPENCTSRYKVAIIVPYRNRETNLRIFLKHMHPFLIKQQLDYGIFLVEPVDTIQFNRGLLMNIGYLESLKLSNNKWECFIFHDVDLLPEDERNIYSCPEIPRHMSSAVSTFNYRLPYDSIFGGVSALTREQMKKVNGYSNLYFGWGGEDDDFRARIVNNGYQISRYPLEIGRYLMATHSRDQVANPQRFNLLNAAIKRMKVEGLNSADYNLLKTDKNQLFTRFMVSYDEKKLLANSKKE